MSEAQDSPQPENKKAVPSFISIATLLAGMGWDRVTERYDFFGPLYFGVAVVAAWFAIKETGLVSSRAKWLRRALISHTIIPLILMAPFVAWATMKWDPGLKDSEDKRNKYVTITRIPHPIHGKGKHGILIEFGVNEIPSECIAFAAKFNAKPIYEEDWRGVPGKTHRQRKMAVWEGGDSDSDDGLSITRLLTNVQLTPTFSYYAYFEADSEIRIDIIEYLTMNASTIADQDQMTRLGSQFTLRK